MQLVTSSIKSCTISNRSSHQTMWIIVEYLGIALVFDLGKLSFRKQSTGKEVTSWIICLAGNPVVKKTILVLCTWL